MTEMIFRIDKAQWQQGLDNARAQAQYDTWFECWRLSFDESRVDPNSAGPTSDPVWNHGVALCQRNGWIIATLVDPENRPINWASPQFPAADKAAWLPIAAR